MTIELNEDEVFTLSSVICRREIELERILEIAEKNNFDIEIHLKEYETLKNIRKNKL